MHVAIPCGKQKATVASAARDLYIGTGFQHALQAVLRDGRPYFIISSKWGLLRPDDVIEPYEAVTKTQTDIDRLARQLRKQNVTGIQIESWCPAAYTEAMRRAGMVITAEPLLGLRQGERAKWLKGHAR